MSSPPPTRECSCSGLARGYRSQRQRAVGKGPYPLIWRLIAQRVKSQAGWRCECCAHPHETSLRRAECDDRCAHPSDGKRRTLTVHHLDMNPERCESWNLVALCQSCHLRVQTRVDWRQSWLGDGLELEDLSWVAALPDWLAWRRQEFLAEESDMVRERMESWQTSLTTS